METLARQYLWIFFLTGISCALLLGGFNLSVDPYGLFGVSRVKEWNALKPVMANNTRMSKPHQLLRVNPNTVLLGNSRVEAGLDPRDPVWDNDHAPIYNFAVGGATPYLQLRFLQHAIAAHVPNTVVIGLDFHDFLPFQKTKTIVKGRSDWEHRLLVSHTREPLDSTGQLIRDSISATLSIDAFTDSLRTIFAQRLNGVATIREDGFNPNSDVAEQIRLHGYLNIFRHSDRTLIKKFLPRGYGRSHVESPASSFQFAQLRQILDLQATMGFDLYLFVHPYHARFLTLIDSLQLWDEYERWKRYLVLVVESCCPAGGKRTLWDFGTFSPMTMELPKPDMRSSTDMNWFWESGHYKSKAGNLMLEVMLGKHNGSDIGNQLTSRNIDSHLSSVRDAKSGFLADHPQVKKEIEKLVSKREQ